LDYVACLLLFLGVDGSHFDHDQYQGYTSPDKYEPSFPSRYFEPYQSNQRHTKTYINPANYGYREESYNGHQYQKNKAIPCTRPNNWCTHTGSTYQHIDCDARFPSIQFQNPSFETGDFSSWAASGIPPMLNPDPPFNSFLPLSVVTAGLTNHPIPNGEVLFDTAPTNGKFAAVNSFDGPGGTMTNMSLCQEIYFPVCCSFESVLIVRFDYRAGWNLRDFNATQDRTFGIKVGRSGLRLALVAKVGTKVDDTGSMTAMVDVSMYAGMTTDFCFEWFTDPAGYTGPAQFQLDNIQVVCA